MSAEWDWKQVAIQDSTETHEQVSIFAQVE